MTPVPTTEPPSILQRLRQATVDQHRHLDGALSLPREGFDHWAYRRLLEGFYGLHAAWEPWAAAQFSTVLPGFFDQRRKLHLLEKDLTALGLSTDEIRNLPACPEVAVRTTFSGTLGAAYVLEGSTLGARILSRHFCTHLGLAPDRGCAYFSAYGDNTAAMWREFAQTLENFAALTILHDDILHGARRTFAAVHRWLVHRPE